MSQRLCESFMKIHQGVQEEMRIRDGYPLVVQWLSPCFALGNPKNHFDRLLKQQMHIYIMSQRLCESFMKIHQGVQQTGLLLLNNKRILIFFQSYFKNFVCKILNFFIFYNSYYKTIYYPQSKILYPKSYKIRRNCTSKQVYYYLAYY